ncbi:MAG: gliding motility-associated C-terminal domain-containing protein, partial [Cyclobacteriaceae bacterium]|nr:gliding motility-associated C-terminal domain-containing protein [Cyclobacteriaceae bacterium]
SKGELLIMGVTSSSDFPTLSNGYDPTFNGGDAAGVLGIGLDNGTDVFVAMLDETGSTLVGHTFLGGSGNDGIMMPSHSLTNNYGDESRGDVYTDENDNIYVASKTASVDFPVVNGIENTHQGGALDAVVVKLKSDLSDILWSTYLGGSGLDAAYSIKKNQAGIVVVAGGTSSADIHAGFMNGFSGIVDGWVALINDTVPALISGQYLGTPQYDQAYFIDLDLSDNIYLYGQTSGDYPVQGNVYQMGDGQFIHKFSPDLSQSLMSTNFGSVHSGPDISPTAFMVNDCNNIYLSGWGGFVNEGYMGGSTNDMPVTVDAYQPITSGSDFYLAVFVDDAQELLYATFLGGTESKTHVDGGTCRFDKKGMVYHAVCSGCQAGNSSGGSSSDFPTTPGAWSATNNSYNCNNAAFKFDLSSLKAGILTNSINLDQPGIASVCLPDQVVFQNTSVGGETFIWDFGNGKRLNTIYDEDIIFQYTDPGTYKVKLRIIDRSTCTETDSTFVFLNVHQPEFDVVENGEMCENEQFYLSASGGVQYRWKDETGNVFSQSPGQAVNPQQDAMYYIDITDSNGCEFSDSVRVEVFPVAEIDFDYERECSTGPDFSFHGQPGDADSVWFDLGNNQLISGQEIVYTYDKEGTFPVTFYAKKGKCINNVVKTIEAFDIRVPSVITPGITDGKNDSFKVFGGSKIDVIIYNRWGGAVFEEEDYQNDWKGDDVGAGTYYYNITFNGSCTCKGWVQVMK